MTQVTRPVRLQTQSALKKINAGDPGSSAGSPSQTAHPTVFLSVMFSMDYGFRGLCRLTSLIARRIWIPGIQIFIARNPKKRA